MTRMLSVALGMTLTLTSLGCQALSLSRYVGADKPASPPAVAVAQAEPVEQVETPPQNAAEPLEPQPPADTPEKLFPPDVKLKVPAQVLRDTTPDERLKSLVEDLDPGAAQNPGETLQLDQLLVSVNHSFPPIQAALREAQVAAGKQLSTRGAFDLKVVAESLNMPQGYYENYRQLAKLEQATWMGGTVYSQYRIGDGSFQPWYGERETNEGGEFKVGAITPLLRGRAIDERRAEIAKADLMQAAVEPAVQYERIQSAQVASYVYWSWVAAGQAYMVTRELLDIAQQRNKAIARQVELGNLARTELQQNERLIVSREAKLIESERKLQSTAIKLSLFWRDANGQPVIPSPAQLPAKFPAPEQPSGDRLDTDIEIAMTQRPELRDLTIQRQAVSIDLAQGENELLPNLSAVVEASKDVGAAASSKGDKTPFELEAGLVFDVPLQRSKARGKLQSASGKMTQLSLKQEYTVDKITTELQDALSAINAAYERIERARRNVTLARQLVDAEYRSFALGNSDVLRIALQEGAELDAQLLEIEALRDYFQARADYRAALGEGLPQP